MDKRLIDEAYEILHHARGADTASDEMVEIIDLMLENNEYLMAVLTIVTLICTEPMIYEIFKLKVDHSIQVLEAVKRANVN